MVGVGVAERRCVSTFLAAFEDGKIANRRRMRRDPRGKSSLSIATIGKGRRGGAQRRLRARLLDHSPTPSSTSRTTSGKVDEDASTSSLAFSSRSRPIITPLYRIATLISLKRDLHHLEPHHLRPQTSAKQWIFVRRARSPSRWTPCQNTSPSPRCRPPFTFARLMLSLRLPPPLGDE
ncbi:hypothetical protein K523DRAFT_422242 [Schizophyllum commune Tattone D]|nr:hypothetical protein K523DRAFT_422242 [Schizophyllum commune Tattone D]